MKAHYIWHAADTGHGYTWQEVADEAAALVKEVSEFEKKLSVHRRKENLSQYKACLTACGKVATKRAFLASQLPQEVVPSAVVDKDTGFATADPVKVLDATVDKYHKLWQCVDHDVTFGRGPKWGGGERLERITAARIRAASKTFKKKTAITHDGLHPRHFSLLSDESLDALAVIFEAMECLGTMSTELRQNLVVLLAKAAGGFRPIGIYTSYERLWTRIRNEEVRQWQDRNKKDFLSCSKGSGAADAVWAQTVRAESGIGAHKHIISGFWDMKSFYDCIDHGLLHARAVSMEFPLVLMNMALAACTAPRVVQSTEGTSDVIYPRRGILAGHGFANAMTQVYYTQVFEAFLRLHPGVILTVYVDDITLTVEHSDREIALSLFTCAAKDLAAIVKEKLLCSYAEGKEAIVASDENLAEQVREALGPLAGKSVTTTPHLGIDFKAGRKRGSKKKGTVRGKRLHTAARRKKKVKSLRSLLGSRVTRHICNAGVIPAAAFGSEVNGLSDRELLIIQQVQGAATAPATSGRSLSASLLATGDDTWRAAAAPMRRWQKEAWRNTVGDSRAKFTKKELQDAWDETLKLQHEWYFRDGSPKWASTRGPIGATILTMERMGWTQSGPFVWNDDLNIERRLEELGPKLFDVIVRDSIKRAAERKVAKSTGYESLKGKRVCFDVIRNFLTAPNRTSKRDKDIVHAVACNAVWTKVRLKDSGYDVEDTKCDLCGTGEDTLFHRIWQCQAPAVCAARNRAARKGLIDEAIIAGSGNPMYTHGFFPHPGDEIQPPCPTLESECWHRDGADGCIDGIVRMNGDIFADGHASRTNVDELNRASWAIVEIDEDDTIVAYARGCVPRYLPQTAQAAEFMAAAFTPQVCGPNTVLHDDCENVVRQFNRPRSEWTDERKVYAGLMRWAVAAQNSSNLDSLMKVPAHVELSDPSLNPVERHKAKGNNLADWHANEAEKLHPKDEAASKEAAATIKTAEAVLRVIAAVVAEWPMTVKQYKRLQTNGRKATKRVAAEDKHVWVREGTYWRCETCRGRTRTTVLPKRREAEKCWGLEDRLARRGEQPLGHDVAEFITAVGNFSICTRCGRYGIQRARGLARVCSGEIRKDGARKTWKRVFTDGLHPHTGRRLDGHGDTHDLCNGIGAMKIRRGKIRKAKLKRLTGKSKPWEAALLGFSTDPERCNDVRAAATAADAANAAATAAGAAMDPDEGMQEEFHDCNGSEFDYEDCDDMFDVGVASTQPTVEIQIEVSDVDRERIAKRRRTAEDTKLNRIQGKEFMKWTGQERDWVNQVTAARKRSAEIMSTVTNTIEPGIRKLIAEKREGALAKKRRMTNSQVVAAEPQEERLGHDTFDTAPAASYGDAAMTGKWTEAKVQSQCKAIEEFLDGLQADSSASGEVGKFLDDLDTFETPGDSCVVSDGQLEAWLEEVIEQEAREAECTSGDTFETAAAASDHEDGQLERWLEESMNQDESIDQKVPDAVESQGAPTSEAPQQALPTTASTTTTTGASSSDAPWAGEQAENWRHKKRRLQSEREAATRPRAIPTMEEAMTPAAIIMAKMAAKFRRKN